MNFSKLNDSYALLRLTLMIKSSFFSDYISQITAFFATWWTIKLELIRYRISSLSLCHAHFQIKYLCDPCVHALQYLDVIHLKDSTHKSSFYFNLRDILINIPKVTIKLMLVDESLSGSYFMFFFIFIILLENVVPAYTAFNRGRISKLWSVSCCP